MLSLTRKAEYAIIALAHLARASDQVVSAREIADVFAIPSPLLMNVLKQLQRAGLLRSARGASGGYRLAMRPADISLARVVEATEGPMRLVRCAPPLASPAVDSCELSRSCPVRQPLQRVHEFLQDTLRKVSIADVAFDPQYNVQRAPRTRLKVLAK